MLIEKQKQKVKQQNEIKKIISPNYGLLFLLYYEYD